MFLDEEKYVIYFGDNDAPKSYVYMEAKSDFIHTAQVEKTGDKIVLSFDDSCNHKISATLTSEMAYELAKTIFKALKVK